MPTYVTTPPLWAVGTLGNAAGTPRPYGIRSTNVFRTLAWSKPTPLLTGVLFMYLSTHETLTVACGNREGNFQAFGMWKKIFVHVSRSLVKISLRKPLCILLACYQWRKHCPSRFAPFIKRLTNSSLPFKVPDIYRNHHHSLYDIGSVCCPSRIAPLIQNTPQTQK